MMEKNGRLYWAFDAGYKHAVSEFSQKTVSLEAENKRLNADLLERDASLLPQKDAEIAMLEEQLKAADRIIMNIGCVSGFDCSNATLNSLNESIKEYNTLKSKGK